MKPRTIVFFIAGIILSLGILSVVFPREGISIGSRTYYFPSLRTLVDDDQRKIELDIKTIPPEISQLSDSILFFDSLVNEGKLRFWLPDSSYFNSFWETAEQAKENNTVVRILHYGDSQIEMDHISSQLRKHLQKAFGGGGPGMLPFQTIVPTRTVQQWNSGNLIHLSSFGDSTVVRSRGNYGLMMQCFQMNGDASVNIRASKSNNVDDRVKQFSNINVVYHCKTNYLSGTLVDLDTKKKETCQKANSTVGKLHWDLAQPSKSLQIRMFGAANIYCITLDDGPGVSVDNIPMRGCSGQQFTLVNESLLTDAYKQLNIGMIIMQFGGNSVPYLKNAKDVSDYCSAIGKQIDYVHKCCPNAKILFIGPSDMSTRLNGQLQTYPIIHSLIDSLASTTTRHGVAFWSIFHAMGGENTMPQWVKEGLAGEDYIHFSQRGADLMGDFLAEAFNNSYQLFCMRRKMKQYNEEK